MRPIRNVLAILALTSAMGVAGVLGGAVAAAPAGALDCTYTVGPTALPPGGGFVTVQGTGPGSSVVRIFTNGVLAATAPTDPVTGAFSAQVFVTASVEITVALDDYPGLLCTGVGGAGGGNTQVGVGGNGTGVNGTGLPRTGSSGTEPLVLAGLAAVAVGAVLVAGSRRLAGLRGR